MDEFEQARDLTYQLGYFPSEVKWGDMQIMAPDHEAVIEAFRHRSMSPIESEAYQSAVVDHYQSTSPEFGGLWGPATKQVFAPNNELILEGKQRFCYVPDRKLTQDQIDSIEDPEVREVCGTFANAAPATGSGNWKGCHDETGWHSLLVDVDMRGISTHFRAVWTQVIRACQVEVARICGLQIRFRDKAAGRDQITGEDISIDRANTNLTFVSRSNGWIGLATVMRGVGCSTMQWLRLLSTFNPRQIVEDLVTLVLHELGHNMGWGHQRGGILNATLTRNRQRRIATSDPYYRLCRSGYGTTPFPLDDGEPEPPPDDPDTPIEQRLARLEVQMDLLTDLVGRLWEKVN